MPRWLEVALTLVLFLVAMAGVMWVVRQTVPGFVDWAAGRVGIGWVWAGILAVLVPAGIFGYWPRDASGRMRRLRSPWD